jgi:hypothetical protein
VPIPPTYREALAVVEHEIAADALTREAFRKLGKPPALPLRLMSFFTLGWAALVNFMFLMIAAKIIDKLFFYVGEWLEVNFYDWFTAQEQILMLWGTAFTIVALGIVLGALGRRRAVGLATLQAALAARPPKRPGGAAECRLCGAPLAIQGNAPGVRCLYCRADNLVALPRAWIERAKKGVEGVIHVATSALELHRRELRKLWLGLSVGLGVVGALALLVIVPIVMGMLRGGESAFDLRRALDRPRELFDVPVKLVGYNSPPVAPSLPVDQCKERYSVPPQSLDCLRDCWVGWFVALRAGEVLELAPRASGKMELYEHIAGRDWAKSNTLANRWGLLVSTANFTPEQPGRVRAERTSWHRVKLTVHTAGPLGLCATLR